MVFRPQILRIAFLLLFLMRPASADLVEYAYDGPGIESIPDSGRSYAITASFSLDDSLFGQSQPAQNMLFDVGVFSDTSIYFPARNEVTTDMDGNIVDLFILFGGVDESLSMTESNWAWEFQGILDLEPQARIESTSPPTISVPEPAASREAMLLLALSLLYVRRPRRRGAIDG